MTGTQVPKFIEDAAFAGASEGNRNDRAFWLAAQCRDARIDKGSARSLLGIFATRCTPPLSEREAATVMESAYRSIPREPPSGRGRVQRPDADEIIPWDGEIGPAKGAALEGEGNPDYVLDVPPPSGDPAGDLRRWLAALFQPDDKVNYVTASAKGDDGRHYPRTTGVTRTRADIEADLDRYEKKGYTGEALLRYVLGDWDAEAGVWARINPMDGNGCGNANVTRLDHVLVEGDEQSIERQMAVISALRLPCSAVVHSGGKSVHAVVRIGAGTDQALYKSRIETLFKKLEAAGFKPDVKCRNSSRLSRMPGPVRGGKPQYLVSGPCGAADWDEWISEQQAGEFSAQVRAPRDLFVAPQPDNLVGERFLCRQGSWLVVAQSGVGKSVFAIQAAVSFAVGRDVFGLRVERPLRNLMIQAENNEGDMHEAFSGICHGLNLGPGELDDLDANFRTVHCSRYTGAEFARFLAHLCRTHKPDIVWIDPLLSYIGGEISKMQDCSRFLQNQIQPVIEDADCGLVVIHHTGKPPKSDENKYKGADLAYLGIGSSVLTNWARATSTLLRAEGEDNRFTLEHAKRGDRCGCSRSVDIRHAPAPGICWLPAEPMPTGFPKKPAKPRRPSKYDGIGLESMPPMSAAWDDETRTSSEAARAVAKLANDAGMGLTLKQVSKLLSSRRLVDFLDYDSEKNTWQGRLYDPDFD